jgi:hypothetical protein
MESLQRSKSVIALGKRLAGSLAKEDDLASAWMAHLVAERMDAAERAAPESRAAAEDACVQEILRLWSHRYASPKRMNPLRAVEPIARALAALDPEKQTFHYSPDALGLAKDEDLKTPNDWLKLALQVDRVSKDLIHFALRKGAEEGFASDEFKTALGEALDGNADVAFEVRLVSFLLDRNDAEQGRLARMADEIVREKVCRLERLAALATELATGLSRA